MTTIVLGTSDFYSVQIMDITGRVVAGYEHIQGDIEIVRNNMVRGMYFVNIANTTGNVKTLKLIVE